jgi:hypothetical protein
MAAANPDGFGLAYLTSNGQLRRYVTLDADRWIERYFAVRRGRGAPGGASPPVLLHARWATQGRIHRDNCHPFRIGRRIVMAHNGHAPGYGNDRRSDSAELAAFLGTLPRPWWRRPTVERFLARYGRFALMRADGDVWLVNGHEGIWLAGSWYSNLSFTVARPGPWGRTCG